MQGARILLIVSGIILTPLYGMATLLLLYGAVAGDCFSAPNHSCPKDHNRNMAALQVLFVAGAVFAALVYGGWKLDRRLAARQDKNDR